MTFDTIDALRESLAQPVRDPAYVAKMMHTVPAADVVDRGAFVVEQCRGKRVIEYGASGPMHDAIVKVAAAVYGVDRLPAPGVVGFDLDAIVRISADEAWDVLDQVPPLDGLDWKPDVVMCGEILEHLANPGWFLERMRRQFAGVPVIVTVPNAFGAIGTRQMRDGTENVNIDHVAWYSYRTLKTLVERYGFTIQQFHWYHGEPRLAEGLIMVLA